MIGFSPFNTMVSGAASAASAAAPKGPAGVRPQYVPQGSTLGQPVQQADLFGGFGNPYAGINQQTALSTYLNNMGGGGGGGGGSAVGGYYGYLGNQAAADATRYGWDQQYRIAEGNARRDWDIANLGANTQRYLGELGSGDTRYTSDNTRYGNFDVANIQRQASDYGNLLNYMGRDIESSRGLQGALGVAGINKDSALGTARIGADANRYIADRGFQSALEQALINAGVSRYGTDKTLEGQLAGFGSQERIAQTQIIPQMMAAAIAQQRFNQMFPFVTQLAGGILGKIPNWGGVAA